MKQRLRIIASLLIFSGPCPLAQAIQPTAPKQCLTIGFAKLLTNRRTLASQHQVALPVIPYDEKLPLVSEFAPGYRGMAIDVGAGIAKEIPPGHVARSSGFDICNVVMIRNRESGRLVLYHHWEAEDIDRLGRILSTFDPQTVEVVLLGNQQSRALEQLKLGLKRRQISKLKVYQVQEMGRWEFAYKQNSDQLLYRNTDLHHVMVIDHAFGPKAARSSGVRRPEFDRALRRQDKIDEIDSIIAMIGHIKDDLPIPETLNHLPKDELRLRQLLLQKEKELIKILPPSDPLREKSLRILELTEQAIRKLKQR